MPPTTSRDFQQAAAQRYTGAEALQRVRLNLDAQYLGGYTVECSLKALILHRTPAGERLAKLIRISSSAAMHRPEVLLGELRDVGGGTPGRDRGADETLPLVHRLAVRYWTG